MVKWHRYRTYGRFKLCIFRFGCASWKSANELYSLWAYALLLDHDWLQEHECLDCNDFPKVVEVVSSHKQKVWSWWDRQFRLGRCSTNLLPPLWNVRYSSDTNSYRLLLYHAFHRPRSFILCRNWSVHGCFRLQPCYRSYPRKTIERNHGEKG